MKSQSSWGSNHVNMERGDLGTVDRRGNGQEEASAEVFGSKSGGAAMVWGQGI